MSYELVTLAACETGRSYVASSDELIVIARGFLNAGAGALVTSLWRVIDDVTPRLMEYFYRKLDTPAHPESGSTARCATYYPELICKRTRHSGRLSRWLSTTTFIKSWHEKYLINRC